MISVEQIDATSLAQVRRFVRQRLNFYQSDPFSI
jgi:hypothetical protein